MSSRPRFNWTLFLALAAAIVAGFVASRFGTFFRQPEYETGDAAVNALQIDHAKHLGELYGNYSRFEFHHPGPAFFYCYAAAEWLLHDVVKVCPTPADAHLFACIVIQGLFLALALALFVENVPWRATLPLALVAAGIHFGGLGDAFVSLWPPNVLLAPFLCFLTAAVSVGSGDLRRLVVLALAGGFLFHGHVAQPLFVGGLGVLALGLGFRRVAADRQARLVDVARNHRRQLIAVGALLVVFLLPLVIDVCRYGRTSNVATIFGRFAYNAEQSNPAFRAFLYFVTFATDTRDQEALFAHAGPELWHFLQAHVLRIGAWTAIFVAPPIWAWLSRRREPRPDRRFLGTASLFLGATIVLCVLWGKAQAGTMYNFNGYFYYGIYYFALLIAIAAVAPWLERVCRLPVGLALGAAGIALLVWQERLTDAPGGGGEVRAAVAQLLTREGRDRPKLLVFEHRNWPIVLGAALALQRDGADFYAAPWWSFMMKRGHEVTRLGAHPENAASIWWIVPATSGGTPLSGDLRVFTEPAEIRADADTIDFAGGANAFRYVVRGASAGNLDCATTELPWLTLRFNAVPTNHDVAVTIDARALDLAPKPVIAEVYFNDAPIGRLTFDAHARQRVVVAASAWNRHPVATLELRFPNALPQHRLYRPDYEWWAALQVYHIGFAAAH